jgi:hypothetical protein
VSACRDCAKNSLILQTVFESGLDTSSGDNGFHEIGNGVSETVFVPDDVPGWPLLVHVRVGWLGDEDVAETLSILRVARVEKSQTIHFFEIKEHRAGVSIDFERE